MLESFVLDKLRSNAMYGELSDSGLGADTLEERIAQIREAYARKEIPLTRQGAIDELVADALPVILTDKATVRELIRLDRTLAERIHDFFEDFFVNLTEAQAGMAWEGGRAENARLTERMDALNEQFRITKGYRPNEKALRSVARDVLSYAGSDYDPQTLAGELRELFDFIGNQDGFDGAAMAMASAIARKVLEQSSERDDSLYDASEAARAYFRNGHISLTALQQQEAARAYDGYGEFVRASTFFHQFTTSLQFTR